MALTINTNAASLNAQRNTVNNMQSLQTTMARLSSGLRVNSAKDDAAGLAIAERLSSQARGMAMGLQNAADGMSLLEVADGAMSSASDVLQRMRELAIRSLNGTNDATSRGNLNAEFTQLGAELTRISTQTSFNGRAIIGASAATQVFQVGANAVQTISVATSYLATVV
jgi:flagellin